MKILKKIAAVFFYLLLLSLALDFQFWKLFDFRQILVFVLGTILLYLPGNRPKKGEKLQYQTISYCSLLTSFIQTFVQIFMLLSSYSLADRQEAGFFSEVALNCRALLYGVIVWGICQILDERSQTAKDGQQEDVKLTKEDISATDAYLKFQRMGLSKREAEVAVQAARGLSNKEIANEFFISEATVKRHLTTIYQKLSIEKRGQFMEVLISSQENSRRE